MRQTLYRSRRNEGTLKAYTDFPLLKQDCAFGGDFQIKRDAEHQTRTHSRVGRRIKKAELPS